MNITCKDWLITLAAVAVFFAALSVVYG